MFMVQKIHIISLYNTPVMIFGFQNNTFGIARYNFKRVFRHNTEPFGEVNSVELLT